MNGLSIHGTVHAAPKTRLPKGATDCHTHVFGPFGRYPLDPDRVYTPSEASIGEMCALHDHLGIERVVIVHPSPYGTDNRVTLDAVARLGDRARAVAVIPATLSDADIEALDERGVRGVRLNLATTGVTDISTIWTVISVLAPKLADQGWHLQLFTNLNVIDQLADRLANLPVTLVFDHFGGADASKGAGQPGFKTLVDFVKSGQAYVKLSAGYRASKLGDQADVAALADVLIRANPDRVVWGTDWPHPGARKGPSALEKVEPFQSIDDGAAVDRLGAWVLHNPDTLRRILVANPARLYGW